MNVLVESVLNGLVGDDGVLGLILDYIGSTSDPPLPCLGLKKARERKIYPFPLTTSSSASFRLELLRGPDSFLLVLPCLSREGGGVMEPVGEGGRG